MGGRIHKRILRPPHEAARLVLGNGGELGQGQRRVGAHHQTVTFQQLRATDSGIVTTQARKSHSAVEDIAKAK